MPLLSILRARALRACAVVVAVALIPALHIGCASSSTEDSRVEVRRYNVDETDEAGESREDRAHPEVTTDTGVGTLPIVTLTSRFVEMQAAELASIFNRAPRAGEMLLLTSDQLRAVDKRIDAGGDVTLLTSPRLSLFSGQRGSLVVSNQIAYLADYAITQTDGLVVADPVVDTINEGVFMQARPVVNEPGAGAGADQQPGILLDLEVQLTFVARPIREVTVRLNSGDGPALSDVTIQVPEVLSQTVRRNLEIRDGDTIAIVNFASQQAWETGDGSVVLVMVTTDIAPD